MICNKICTLYFLISMLTYSFSCSAQINSPQDSTPATYQPADTKASATTSDAEVANLVRELGQPVSFDQVFSALQAVPRFKDEFETTLQFDKRQAVALAEASKRYLIEVPVDPEHLRYDADRQKLVVATYALTNRGASDRELSAVFGFSSKLQKSGVKVKYSGLNFGNVLWGFPLERQTTGMYDASNSFGKTVTVLKQEGLARAVFERKGKYRENVWTEVPAPYVENSPPVAFEIAADPQKARKLKAGGLQAAIVIQPKSPYYANGIYRFSPTIRAPYDRTTKVHYLIGDIQAVAIFDANGDLIATRKTR